MVLSSEDLSSLEIRDSNTWNFARSSGLGNGFPQNGTEASPYHLRSSTWTIDGNKEMTHINSPLTLTFTLLCVINSNKLINLQIKS